MTKETSQFMIASDLLRVAECAIQSAFSRSEGLNRQEIAKLRDHLHRVASNIEQRQIDRIKEESTTKTMRQYGCKRCQGLGYLNPAPFNNCIPCPDCQVQVGNV